MHSKSKRGICLQEITTRNAKCNLILSLPDGRKLGYCVVGQGTPVFYFHGTASSRLEVLLLEEFALANQFQIICVDRPGYGLSTFAPRKHLRDFAEDLNYLADNLGLERFQLLGWSGGGPFLLAYFSFHPERVTQAVVVGSPNLPFDISEAHSNPFARYAMKYTFIGMIALKRFEAFVFRANNDIGKFLKSKAGKNFILDYAPADRKFFSNPIWLRLMINAMTEAFSQGNTGIKTIIQEHQLFMKNWDIPLRQIQPEKLHIWQGTDDKTCKTENAYLMAKIFPGSHLEIFKGKGHCVMFDNLEKLSKCLSGEGN